MPALVERYRAFAIDIDGVVWRGDQLLEGAREGIAGIRRQGKPLLLLSNNANYSPSWVASRLSDQGIEVDPSEVLTSAVVAREWLRAQGLEGAKALVMGDRAVIDQLIDVVKIVPPDGADQAAVVLVARDTAFSFGRLTVAANAVRRGGLLVAVNRDSTLPVPGGFEPGTGAVLAAIEAASERRGVVLGKPEAPMMEAAVRILGASDVLMVGDRPEADVAGARRAGWAAALVLTGAAGEGPYDPAPDYVIPTLEGILKDSIA
jgi:4-nitrophenyl phosphatase